jgi:hypothetical protein
VDGDLKLIAPMRCSYYLYYYRYVMVFIVVLSRLTVRADKINDLARVKWFPFLSYMCVRNAEHARTETIALLLFLF